MPHHRDLTCSVFRRQSHRLGRVEQNSNSSASTTHHDRRYIAIVIAVGFPIPQKTLCLSFFPADVGLAGCGVDHCLLDNDNDGEMLIVRQL